MADTMLTMLKFTSITQVAALIEKVGGDLAVVRVENGVAYLRQAWWPASVEMRLCVDKQYRTQRAFYVYLEHRNPRDGSAFRVYGCDTAWKSRALRKFITSMREFLWQVVAANKPGAMIVECEWQNRYKCIQDTMTTAIRARFGSRPGGCDMGTYTEPVVGQTAGAWGAASMGPEVRNVEYAKTRFTPTLGYAGATALRMVQATASITVEFPIEPADVALAVGLYDAIRALVTEEMDGPLGMYARAGKARSW